MGDLVGEELRNAFGGERVLVTGSTGFKGSWLACWLHSLGAEVHGFALRPERKEDLFSAAGLESCIRQEYGDIRDYPRLLAFFQAVRPSFVFHLAAQPLVRRSYEEPKLTVDTNVGGSLNVLEAVRNTSGIRSLVYVTSDKCYLNREQREGYREEDVLGGRDLYSASKAAAEIIFAAYSSSFFEGRRDFGAASARAGNVVGGGDWAPDRIVPDCIRAISEGRPIRLRQPDATRPWQHVLEPLAGYLTLARLLAEDPARFRGSYNFGPDPAGAKTVRELAEAIVRGWGRGSVEIVGGEKGFGEAGLLYLNSDKARRVLGWRPGWDFRLTIEKTVDWYREYLRGADPLDLTRAQIREYMESFG
ncbi:MAG TPA: CDP-glucose 4,6-dehydratase [Methanomicrobiales archaeon]|nr:CDP-glucose 4,6-dehydratase [Methanomicrobiales archaeon]